MIELLIKVSLSFCVFIMLLWARSLSDDFKNKRQYFKLKQNGAKQKNVK